MINLNDYINKTAELDTQAFQRAIDIGSERGGETVFVPFGTYRLSTVILRDNTNLVFEDGVKIFSAEKISDFNPDEKTGYKLYQDLSHSKYSCSMFYARDIKNVSVRGQATIDMKSLWDDTDGRSEFGDGYYRGAKVFALRNVVGLRLSDFKIYNATDIAVLMGGYSDVIISKLYINSHIDGISPDPVIEETFAFRLWVMRKHIVKTDAGFLITEFLPPVYWSGKYNTINAPLIHHLNEFRWLKNSDWFLDYIKFFIDGEGSAYSYHVPALAEMYDFCNVTANEKFLKENVKCFEKYFDGVD